MFAGQPLARRRALPFPCLRFAVWMRLVIVPELRARPAPPQCPTTPILPTFFRSSFANLLSWISGLVEGRGPLQSYHIASLSATRKCFSVHIFIVHFVAATSAFIPSAFKYPSFTRHFCRRTLSSNSAKARLIVSCSGRAFSRSSACAVPLGNFANSTIFPQSAGGITLTTADGFSIFLYGPKAHPMLFFSSAFTNCAIHSSVFSPVSPIQIGTS